MVQPRLMKTKLLQLSYASFKFFMDWNTAFVNYLRIEDATEALKNLNGKRIGGDQILVDYLRSHPSRRLLSVAIFFGALFCSSAFLLKNMYGFLVLLMIGELLIFTTQVDVEGNETKPVTLGTSNDLRVGQNYFAIGNHYGYENTLTTGVVSGLGREIPSPNGSAIRGAIQIDVAINTGYYQIPSNIYQL